MNEQIISHGHTTPYEWQKLEQRSRDTQQRIQPQCPACNAEIHPTDTTDLRCLSCHAPVEIYQHRELTETADRRVIYIQVKGQRRPLLTLDLQCLSCERRLQADETCTNTCEIQTYLTLEHQDAERGSGDDTLPPRSGGELYIKRAANLPHVQRDTPEIDIRNFPDTDSLTRANETPENQTPNQPLNQPQAMSDDQSPEYPNAHIDIAGQIVAFLSDADDNTATTAEMRKAIGCTTEGFNKAVKKLIAQGQIRKVKRGVYQLIHHP